MSNKKKKKEKMTINMNELQIKEIGRQIPTFRETPWMTEKDRPRKKIKPREVDKYE